MVLWRLGLTTVVALMVACAPQSNMDSEEAETSSDEHGHSHDEKPVDLRQCKRASKSQIAEVNRGNAKRAKFLEACARETGGSKWCDELTRPNPQSLPLFRCTYGANQPHQLIHPVESTWKNAFGAVKLIQDLEQRGLRVCQIYNWWRPEPYNRNVSGAPGRHPTGGAVDVRFCTQADADKAFYELCKERAQGRMRAIGYYGTTGLHFGVADAQGNTWGKSCP